MVFSSSDITDGVRVEGELAQACDAVLEASRVK
jgi:hypothetical protein